MPLNSPFDPYNTSGGNGGTNPAVLVDKMIGTAYDVVKHVCLYMAEVRHVSANMMSIFKVSENIEMMGVTRARINVDGPAVNGTTVVTLSSANGVPDVDKIVGLHAILKTDAGVIVTSGSEFFHVSISGTTMTVAVLAGAPGGYANGDVVVFIEIEE